MSYLVTFLREAIADSVQRRIMADWLEEQYHQEAALYAKRLRARGPLREQTVYDLIIKFGDASERKKILDFLKGQNSQIIGTRRSYRKRIACKIRKNNVLPRGFLSEILKEQPEVRV